MCPLFRLGSYLPQGPPWQLCLCSSRGEFRETRISEFFRLCGAGYRVLGRVGVPYSQIGRLPVKWFRLWLMFYHPRTSGGLPWVWWLSAGRGFIVPPEAVGVLHMELLEPWYASLDKEGWDLQQDVYRLDAPYTEEVIFRPWCEMYLRTVYDVASRLIRGELIDPLLDWVKCKNDLSRLPRSRGSSVAARKWSLAYKLYDRMSRILSRPLPKLLT